MTTQSFEELAGPNDPGLLRFVTAQTLGRLAAEIRSRADYIDEEIAGLVSEAFVAPDDHDLAVSTAEEEDILILEVGVADHTDESHIVWSQRQPGSSDYRQAVTVESGQSDRFIARSLSCDPETGITWAYNARKSARVIFGPENTIELVPAQD